MLRRCLAAVLALAALPVAADEADLERRLLQLERDLARLEADLAAPPDARLGVYLEVDTGVLLDLQAVTLELDGHPLAAALYRANENDALERGGVDRLYLGTIDPGEHRLTIIVTGIGPHRRPYRLGHAHTFRKAPGPLNLVVRLADDGRRLQPRIEVRPW